MVVLTCDSCDQKYHAKTDWGLHVCGPCEKRGGPPPKRTTTPGTGRRPKTIVCYVCGREFGTASIKIHQPQCIKKYTIEQSRLPPEQRKPLVKPAEDNKNMTRDEFNEAMMIHREAMMAQCQNCKRTFNPDRLEIHQRSCRPGSTAKQLENKRYGGQNNSTTQPNRNANGGGKAVARRSLVQPSSEIEGASSTNTTPSPTMRRAYVKQSNITFDSEGDIEFEEIVRATTPTGPRPPRVLGGGEARRLAEVSGKQHGSNHTDESSLEGAFENGATSDLSPCVKCGRTFGRRALSRHERVCKASPTKNLDGNGPDSQTEGGTSVPRRADSRKKQAKAQSKWRQQHEEVQLAMKVAREQKAWQKATGRSIAEMPMTEAQEALHRNSIEKDDRVECPFCQRKFSEDASNRHIPICASTSNRPRPVTPEVLSDRRPGTADRNLISSRNARVAGGGGGGNVVHSDNSDPVEAVERNGSGHSRSSDRSRERSGNSSGRSPTKKRDRPKGSGRKSLSGMSSSGSESTPTRSPRRLEMRRADSDKGDALSLESAIDQRRRNSLAEPGSFRSALAEHGNGCEAVDECACGFRFDCCRSHFTFCGECGRRREGY